MTAIKAFNVAAVVAGYMAVALLTSFSLRVIDEANDAALSPSAYTIAGVTWPITMGIFALDALTRYQTETLTPHTLDHHIASERRSA